MAADRILDRLNDTQREAVTHDAGPLLIIAGAGTGKTTVITRRIAWLIAQKKARPEEILALTFTDKAAAEMEERVDTLVPYGYADVEIATFHAFGDRLLREHALELGRERRHRLRRPDRPRPQAPALATVRARRAPAEVQVHPRRRVPGHELGPVRDREAARRAAHERRGRWR